MKVACVDLFCGAGGLTCGLEKAGLRVKAGLDIDRTCKYAYEHNNKSKFICADINSYPSTKILHLFGKAKIKVLVGCAPCQPFSRLKKEKYRNSDSKWKLLYSFLDKIKDINPEIISMENVPAIRKTKVFEDFVNGLNGLGYHVFYQILNAVEFGVPERRMRLILLASKLGKISISKKAFRPTVTVRAAIGNLPPIKAGEVCSTDPLHRCRSLSALNIERIKHSKPGGTWHDWPENLRPKCYQKSTGLSYTAVYGRMEWDQVSPTLTTQFDVYGTGRYGHPSQDRALSLREGALLQSFPLSYQFIDPNNQVNQNDIARQIGNAVPPNLGFAIGISIKEHLRENGILL